MSSIPAIVRVLVPGPLTGPFDYRQPPGLPAAVEGARVLVRFGRRRLVGVVAGHAAESDVPDDRLRPLEAVVDREPLFPAELLGLLRWAARYYHHPLGETLLTAMPILLRQGRPARPTALARWRATAEGRSANPESLLRRAPRQAAVLHRLQHQGLASTADLAGVPGDWRGAMDRLVERGLVVREEVEDYGLLQGEAREARPPLNDEQRAAADAITRSEGFTPLLLEGITGSGKTEVYLEAIASTLHAGRQALLIVPEIGLTPQLVERFATRLDARIALLHSGLGDAERLGGWLAAREGAADVIIGTRSAVFTPLPRAGLIILDEEHDGSLTQQDGLRYSARDLALVRAQRLDVPVVLGSATPSFESLHNVAVGRYGHRRLSRRATGASMPRFRLLDVRGRPMADGLSEPLVKTVREHLAGDGQVLLFLNRRGYAPTLICHECGWLARCQRCDARLTLHQQRGRLRCHHCDYARPVDRNCPDCGSVDLRPLGLGTERVERAVAERFADVPMVRIDRDSTRRKGAFEQRIERVRSGEARILLGTQMLAKGHHLPGVTLVGIIDADQGLFGADFRSQERFAQLVVQVAGRAGREERAGEVVIQTHYPEHPLMHTLIEHGYAAFAREALAEREAAGLPPYRCMALIRAEAVAADTPQSFLEAARGAADGLTGRVDLLGPMPAPMERRAGRYRAQIVLMADRRADLHGLLDVWLPRIGALREARQVRWSVDVDPADTL